MYGSPHLEGIQGLPREYDRTSPTNLSNLSCSCSTGSAKIPHLEVWNGRIEAVHDSSSGAINPTAVSNGRTSDPGTPTTLQGDLRTHKHVHNCKHKDVHGRYYRSQPEYSVSGGVDTLLRARTALPAPAGPFPDASTADVSQARSVTTSGSPLSCTSSLLSALELADAQQYGPAAAAAAPLAAAARDVSMLYQSQFRHVLASIKVRLEQQRLPVSLLMVDC
jgi:hypothetical protein